MSPREICWRLGAKAQTSIDRCMAPIRRRPLRLSTIARHDEQATRTRLEVLGRHLPDVGGGIGGPPALDRWRAALIDKAERLCRNRLTLFDLEDHDLGEPIDWNYEHKAGRKTPMAFAPAIDYRDFAVFQACFNGPNRPPACS
jgi:hypothetical protein